MRAATLSAVLTALAHWALAPRRPAPAADPIAPAAVPVLSESAIGHLIDAAAQSWNVVQGLPAISVLILAVLAAVTTRWLMELGVGRLLAVSAGVGATFLATPWSSETPGADVLALVLALLLTRALASRRTGGISHARVLLVGVALVVLIVHAPMYVWLTAPLLLLGPNLRLRHRTAWATVTLALAGATAFAYLRQTLSADACLADAGAAAWSPYLLHPGATPGSGPLTRVAAAGAAVTAELHAFGLAMAAWAIGMQGDDHPRLRRTTLAGLLVLTVALALGMVTTRTAVIVLVAWWLPWFGLASQALADHARGRWAVVAHGIVTLLVVALPIGRNASPSPDTVVAGTPRMRAAVVASAQGDLVTTDDSITARLARLAGRPIVPADAEWVRPCLAAGRRVTAVGGGVDVLYRQGVILAAAAHAVSAATVFEDVWPGSVVAFGATADGLRLARPSDAHLFTALGLPTDPLRRHRARALVVQVPSTRPADTGTTMVTSDRIERVSSVGSVSLWYPVSVNVEPDLVSIAAGPHGGTALVRSRTAGVTVFDRTETPVVRGTARALPGLPMTLVTVFPALQVARVVGLGESAAEGSPAEPLLEAESRRVLDDDTPYDSPVTVGTGWHDAEKAGSSVFRWSADRRATAHFYLAQATGLTVSLDAAPAQTPSLPNTLRLLLNDQPLARSVAGGASIDVPAAATRAGRNTLTFDTDAVVPPGTVAGEPRALAAVVRHLRIVRR